MGVAKNVEYRIAPAPGCNLEIYPHLPYLSFVTFFVTLCKAVFVVYSEPGVSKYSLPRVVDSYRSGPCGPLLVRFLQRKGLIAHGRSKAGINISKGKLWL